MPGPYFNDSSIDTSDILDATQIDAADVKTPLDNLVSAINTMDSHLDTDISDHETRLTSVEEVVVGDEIDLPILTSTPSSPAADHVRLFMKEVGQSPDLVPQLHLVDESGGVHPVARHNKAYELVGIGSLSTTSTTFTTITGAEITLDTHGDDVLVVLNGSFTLANIALFLDFSIDGVQVSGGPGLYRQVNANNGSETISIVYLARDLAAGSHTFRALWRVSTGTAQVSAAGPWARFWTREL